MSNIMDMSDASRRRRAQSPINLPSTPPLQPRSLDWAMETPGANLTPVVNYAAATVDKYPSRSAMFGSPQSHSKGTITPTQAFKGRDAHAHSNITPQPRAPWMSIASPLTPEETPNQWNRSRTPRASDAQPAAQSPHTPRTPRRRSSPGGQAAALERSPAIKAFAPKARGDAEACWRMDWNEPWLPQPPPPFFPSSWGILLAGGQNAPASPLSGKVWSAASPLGSPTPCRVPGGRSDESLEELAASQDPNEDRFVREFADAVPLGKGQFATVFKATSKLDRQSYALKVVRRSTAGGDKDRMSEVHVLASVAAAANSCPHLLSYFSSWMEDGDLYIQTELCGGSLRAQLRERRLSSPSSAFFAQDDIARVALHVATGLAVLHRLGYAHLDVKPDNILMGQALLDGGVCYKLGDFGLAGAVPTHGGPAPRGSVNEGDCRYLAMEVLRGGVADVTKADIFALGLVCYEMATNHQDGPPANGEAWQQLRSGQIEAPAALSEPLLALTRGLLHPEAERRPSAAEVLRSPALSPEALQGGDPEAQAQADLVAALRAQLAAARAEAAAAEAKARLLAAALAAAGL